jgi:hypothetical protein
LAQKVRSPSNGRTPEGLKMNKYEGNVIKGERTVVPLGQSKYLPLGKHRKLTN